MQQDRRRFLKLGLAGTVGFTALGTGLRFLGVFGYADKLAPRDTPIALSTKEFAVVKALSEILLPASPGFPSGEELGIPQRVDEEVWAAQPKLASDLKLGLQVLEHAPLLYGHLGRFTALDPETRARAFRSMLTSDNQVLVQVCSGFKLMFHFFYYNREATWKGIGYEGPFVPTPVPPESARAYAALLAERRGKSA